MTYFKLIDNNEIIGVVTSNNFMRYMPIPDCYSRADEKTGEFVSYKGQFYRSAWMQPMHQIEKYKDISIIRIEKNEYDILLETFQTQETIEIIPPSNPIEDEEEPYIDPVDVSTLDLIRSTKIKEMSYTCNKIIERGFDIELQGEIHHFSLTVQDQLNLITLSSMAAQGIQQIPYHADGELCKFYSPEEINAIVNTATMFKTYHTTYYNGLKAYINSLDNIEDISEITYGIDLPEEYQTDVWKEINQ